MEMGYERSPGIFACHPYSACVTLIRRQASVPFLNITPVPDEPMTLFVLLDTLGSTCHRFHSASSRLSNRRPFVCEHLTDVPNSIARTSTVSRIREEGDYVLEGGKYCSLNRDASTSR